MHNAPTLPAPPFTATPQNARRALVDALDRVYAAQPAGPCFASVARVAAAVEDAAGIRGPAAGLAVVAAMRAYLDAAHAVLIEARRTEVLAALVSVRAEALAYGREVTASLLSVLAERVAGGACDGDLGRAEARVAEVRESLQPIDAVAVAS